MEELMELGNEVRDQLSSLIMEKEDTACKMLAALELTKFSIPMDTEDMTFYDDGDEYLVEFGVNKEGFAFVTDEGDLMSATLFADTVEDLQRIFKYAQLLDAALKEEVKKRASEWSTLLEELNNEK